MADQDYPNLYALMEASIARVRDAALAYEKTLGGGETELVPVNGYPPQPTIAGRVDAAIDALAATMESAAMQELRSLLVEIPVSPGVTSAHEFSDGFGFILAKILMDGTLDLPGFQLTTAERALVLSDMNGFICSYLGLSESNINGLTIQPEAASGIYIVDDYGFVIGKADKDGVYFGQQVPLVLPPVVGQLDQHKRTDHKHLIMYGQSLAVGRRSTPPISLTQPHANLMFASGVRIHAGEAGYDATSYVPLVESEDVALLQGETPASGWANGVTRRAVEAGESPDRWAFVACSPGRSGNSVEQLSPMPLGAGANFEPMIQQIKDANKLSASLGKTHSVWGYGWVQGEGNYSSFWENSPIQYMEYQLALWDRATQDIIGITGQKFRPYMFTYQVAAHRQFSRDDMPIALTQWRISRQRADVVIAAPCYMFPVASDLLHLTNEGSWLLGEYFSRATYHTMANRAGKWRPLEPISVDWGTTTVDIKFHVPCGKLVLDNALATLAANMGFGIREGNTPAAIITGVAVTGIDTVRLTLSREAAVDSIVTYARGIPGDPVASGPVTGARGNLRDTHGDFDQVTSPLGNLFKLHNACVMFQYSRKTGF